MRNDDLAASRQTDKAEVDQIFTDAWEAAARINPLLLAKLGPEYSFERLREMISDCLKRGLSAAQTRAHTVKELLHSAVADSQPRNTCEDSPRQAGQSLNS